jgi:TonB-dependent receptor
LSFGDKYGLGGGRELGAIAALTYKQSYATSEFTEATEPGGVETTRISGERYRYNVLWGGLVNLNYRANENHKFGFKNNYIRTAKQDVSVATGIPASADSIKKQTAEWNERTLYLGQVSGNHNFPFAGKNGLDLTWQTFYSDTKAKEPDRKNLDDHPHAWIDTIWILAENHRTWSDLTEESAGFDLNLENELGKFKWKAGALYSVRQRDFAVDAWYTDRSFLDTRYSLLSILPPDQIFANENYGTDEEGNNKFRMISWTDLTGEYSGKHDLFSYYAMADMPFKFLWQRWRAAGGVRVEHSDQKVYTELEVADPTEEPIYEARIDEVDVLPSLNLTWLVHDLANIRFGYYQSVNRPEFREMSGVKYFDFQRLRNVKGRPGLKRAEISSYDIRLEFFPDIGEVLAVSYFYKDLKNAIEEELLANPDRFVQTWFNSETGVNYGYELEARKTLGFIGSYFRNIQLGANYTKVESKIDYEDPPNSGIINQRPLQGQAPWMVNASFTFVEPTLGTTFSVLYNRFGRRLDGVGDSREEDVYEEGRDLIDLAVTQRLVGGSKLKFTVRNLTGKDEVYTWGTSKRIQEQLSVGTTYGLSFSYTF